jgi:chromosome condensin MukBEF ATPase and DNA-binding subunit MukB
MKYREKTLKEQDKELFRIRQDVTEYLFIELVRKWNTCILIKDELEQRGWKISHLEDETPRIDGGIF